MHALHTNNDNQHVGKQIHMITGTKSTSLNYNWGAQAIKKSYLCQWTTTPITMKWVGESQLLHTNNITLNYNLFLLHKFTQDTYNENTLANYDSYINLSQFKDWRFNRPPIETSQSTMNIKEYNLDEDIYV